MSECVGINKLLLLLEFANALDNHPSLCKITDRDGFITIPTDKFDDFSDDFSLIIKRLLKRLSEPHDKNKLTDE